MRTTRKRILTTAWLILGGIAIVIGFVVEWASNPHVWITVLIVVATSAAVYLTWRKPSSDDPLEEVLTFVARFSTPCSQLVALLREMRDFYFIILNNPHKPMKKPLFFYQVETALPPKIKRHLGKPIHDHFVTLVADAKTRSQGDPFTVTTAAFPYLEKEIWDAIFAELDERGKQLAANQKPEDGQSGNVAPLP